MTAITPAEAVRLLDHWTDHGGDFPDFRRHWFRTVEEAEAIARALQRGDLTTKPGKLKSPALFKVAACMQSPFTKAADQVLRTKACPQLRRLLADAFNEFEPTDEMRIFSLENAQFFALKNLAYYGEAEDIPLITRAARSPRFRDDPMWMRIFEYTHRSNSAADELIEALRDPLPDGFLRIAFLDFANWRAFDNHIQRHPFDTKASVDWMATLFSSEDESEDSYAVSAANSAPFLSAESKQRILQLAASHPRRHIREEGEWARLRDSQAGAESELATRCLDPRLTTRAANTLIALGRKELIPSQTYEPTHQALVRMSQWLECEQAFEGRPPDSILLRDHRTLNWLPEGERHEFWLIDFACNESDHGYSGIGAVWSKSIDVLRVDKGEPPELYASLLEDLPGFPQNEDPLALLRKLNPNVFG